MKELSLRLREIEYYLACGGKNKNKVLTEKVLLMKKIGDWNRGFHQSKS